MVKRYICMVLAVLLSFAVLQMGYAEELTTIDTTNTVAEPEQRGGSLAEQLAKDLGAVPQEYDPATAATIADLARVVNVLEPSSTLSEKYFEKANYAKEVKCVTAVAVMLDVLGYSPMFSGGTIDTANADEIRRIGLSADVLDSADGAMDAIISMEELVTLLWNTLKADAVEGVYTPTGVNEVRRTGVPYMERALNLYFVNGIVNTTAYASILEEDVTGEVDSIQVGSERYSCNGAFYEESLGKNVTAVIQKADGHAVQDLLITLYEEDNRSIIIYAEDLDFEHITKERISYYHENGRKREVKLDSKVDVMYNYQLKKNFTADDLKIESGRLVLIDHDGDGEIEVVKIESYISFEILRASEIAQEICDKEGNVVSLAKMIEYGVPILSGGTPVEIHNIAAGSVATCFVNANGEIMRMYINSDTVSGKVYRFNTTKRYITIDDKEYRYTKEVAAELQEKVTVGWSITALLNYYGEVTSFKVKAKTSLYGFLLDVSKGIFGKCILRVYTEQGEFIEYETRKKLVVNGINTTAAEAINSGNNTFGFYDEIGFIRQLIKYRVDSNNDITSISTSTEYNGEGLEQLEKYKEGEYVYRAPSKEICADVRLNDETKVFIIPNSYTMTDKEFFAAGGHSTLETNKKHIVSIYDVDDDQYAGAVVKFMDPSEPVTIDNQRGDAYIILEKTSVLGEEDVTTGFIAHKIGSEPGEVSELKCKDDKVSGSGLTVTDIQPGDVIQAGLYHDQVTTFQMMYRRDVTVPNETYYHVWAAGDGTPTITAESFYSDGAIYVNGVVKKILKEGFIANFKDKNDPEYAESWELWDRVITTDRASRVAIFEDTGRGRLMTEGYVGDIQEGDRIFILFRNMEATEIIIYR